VDTIHKIILVILATGTVILLAFFAPAILFGLIALTLATATIIGGFIGYYRMRERRQDVAMRDLDLQDKSQDILIKATLAQAQIRQIDSGSALVSSIGNFTFEQHKRAPQLKVESPPPAIDVLTALDSAQRVLIVGSSNSGKTTLLKHILQRRQSAKLVIDPHASPHKWQGCKVAGIGRNYGEIQSTLDSLLALMDSRYEEIGLGVMPEMGHPPLAILIDEWRSITAHLSDAGSIIRTLLTESRKAAFSMFVVSHSERAKPLGILGEADLKEGFTVVRLGFEGGERVATVDGSIATLPGAFVVNPPPQTVLSLPVAASDGATLNVATDSEPMDAKIVRLYQEGLSKNKICSIVFGSKNGKNWNHITGVISGFEGGSQNNDETS